MKNTLLILGVVVVGYYFYNKKKKAKALSIYEQNRIDLLGPERYGQEFLLKNTGEKIAINLPTSLTNKQCVEKGGRLSSAGIAGGAFCINPTTGEFYK